MSCYIPKITLLAYINITLKNINDMFFSHLCFSNSRVFLINNFCDTKTVHRIDSNQHFTTPNCCHRRLASLVPFIHDLLRRDLVELCLAMTPVLDMLNLLLTESQFTRLTTRYGQTRGTDRTRMTKGEQGYKADRVDDCMMHQPPVQK